MNIAEKLVTVANNTPAVVEAVKATRSTASGGVVRVDDVLSVEHPFGVHLKSKNLADIAQGLNYALSVEGNVYTIMKTETGRWSNYIPLSIPANTTFTMSLVVYESYLVTTFPFQIQFIFADGTDTTQSFITVSNIEWSKSYTKDIVKIVIYIDAAEEVGAYTKFGNFQIELGSTATAYTPYITDFSGVNVTSYGKNLIDFVGLLGGESYTNEANGLSVYIENGCAVITGTHTYAGWTNILAADRFNDSVADPVIILPAGTYSVPSGLTVQLNNPSTGLNTNYTKTFTLTEPHRLATFYVAYSGEGKVVNNTIPLVIVAGTTAPPEYAPYVEPQTATADANGKATGLQAVAPTTTIVAGVGTTAEVSYFPESAAEIYGKYQALTDEITQLRDSIHNE